MAPWTRAARARARRLLSPFEDLRLRVSAVILGLQVLGQVGLAFKVSIAQVAVSIATAVALELGITAWRERRLVRPSSALLTGNGVGLILRTAGTHHGDWWSLNGVQYFALASAVGILSKHLVRVRGRHVFNPSNFGLVACLLVAGPLAVYPQYLWWGDISASLVLAYLLIAAGALWVLEPLRMEPMVVAFAGLFMAGSGLAAISGSCFDATWSVFHVCGASYWTTICLSPELLVFALFMMTDPRTTPGSAVARAGFGLLTALAALVLMYLQPTEYGIKLAILAALVLVCAAFAVPEVLAFFQARQVRLGAAAAAVMVLLVVAVVPVAVAALSGNQQIRLVEQGRPPPGVPSQG